MNSIPPKAVRKPSKRKDYIPNALFHEEMLKWRLELREDPNAPVPAILAEQTKKGYVNNISLYREFVLWRKRLETNPSIQMNNFIGKAILDTAKGLINFHTFSRYTKSWKEEMVGNAIQNCVRYCKNYDDELYTNPHAYLSKLCETPFIQFIKKEKRENTKRYKHFITEVFDLDMADQGKVDYNFYLDMNNKVHEYESKIDEKRTAGKRKSKNNHKCLYNIPEEIKTSLEMAFDEE